jgi:translation initiation factor 1
LNVEGFWSTVKERVVYSSEKGRMCARCGWPVADCHCSGALSAPQEPVPAKITAKLNVANTSSGKRVTIVEGLPANEAFLHDLAHELKKRCGTGGKTGANFVELQGDQRDRLRDLLSKKGWTVKG